VIRQLDDIASLVQRVVATAESAGHFERVEQERNAEAAQNEQRKAEGQVELLGERGIPRRHGEVLVRGKLKATAALKAASEWWQARPRDIIAMAGPPGCGKSVAAAWCVGKANQGALFVTARELLRVSVYDGEQMSRLERAPLLALDDLGAEFADTKGMFSVLVDALVDARHSELRPTVLTTNLKVEAFRQRYGDRVVDRIRDGRFYQCAEGSLRGGNVDA